MSTWRFYPCRDYPRAGILIDPNGKATAAEYYRVGQIKNLAPKEAESERA